MRIIKRFDVNRYKTLSDSIDKVFLSINFPWNLEKIIFSLSNKNDSNFNYPNAEIFLNPKIRKQEESVIKLIIFKEIFSLLIKIKNMESGIRFIDNIIANREMIKNGFGDYYLNYAYVKLFRPIEIENFHTFLTLNLPWISFSGLDNFNSVFLKDMVKKFKYPKTFETRSGRLFSTTEKDLTDKKNLRRAINLYNEVVG